MNQKERSKSSQAHERSIESYSYRIITVSRPKQEKRLALDRAAQQHILPYMKDMDRWLNRTGCSPSRNDYRPSQQQQKQFQMQRYKQLKLNLTSRKRKVIPFDFDLDQIVLDCYDYREEHGRHSIWKKYRGDVDLLSYRVHLLRKGRV